MVSFEWKIGPMNVKLSEDGLSNVVYSVNWDLTGTDGAYSAHAYGVTNVPAPTSDSFTPYDQLTEAQVLGWVFEALGTEQKAAYEQSIAGQIERMKNPVDASLQPPWSNE